MARLDIPIPGWALDLMEDRSGSTESTSPERAELLAQLPAAVDRLKEPHRSIVEAVFYEGLSRQQLADRYEVRPHVIQTWTRQALKQIKEGLARTHPAASEALAGSPIPRSEGYGPEGFSETMRIQDSLWQVQTDQRGPVPVSSEVVRADRAA